VRQRQDICSTDFPTRDFRSETTPCCISLVTFQVALRSNRSSLGDHGLENGAVCDLFRSSVSGQNDWRLPPTIYSRDEVKELVFWRTMISELFFLVVGVDLLNKSGRNKKIQQQGTLLTMKAGDILL
jgi:hypothetical protein